MHQRPTAEETAGDRLKALGDEGCAERQFSYYRLEVLAVPSCPTSPKAGKSLGESVKGHR